MNIRTSEDDWNKMTQARNRIVEALAMPSADGSVKEHAFSKSWYWITLALAIVTTISVFAIPDNGSPLVTVRSVLGVIFVLFLPGFAFTKALFPEHVQREIVPEKNLDLVERLALSLGMSLVITPITVLILNSTPLGVKLTPVTLSLLTITLLFSTVAVFRESPKKWMLQTQGLNKNRTEKY
jgi:uncharacterized membrane protein